MVQASRWRRGVVALVVVGFALLAAASPAKADVGVLGIVPGSHACENFGVAHRGYIAGHCVDLEVYVGNDGTTLVRAVGQAFCQRVSDHVIVQCAGIVQDSWAYNGILGEWGPQRTDLCGRYANHSPACPPGRFRNWGYEAGAWFDCWNAFAAVSTRIVLPVSGQIVQSDGLYTNPVEC